MKLGIQKRQWFFLFLALSLPLLLNVIAIWRDIGINGVVQLSKGEYYPSNPNLPIASTFEILSELLLNAAFLGLISWVMIFISNKSFFQKQWLIVKIIEMLLMAIFIAKVFEMITGFFMPLAWLPEFHDQIGFPGSFFTSTWSHWFIFPATAIILFITLLLSRNKSLESNKIGETVNAL